MRFKGKVHKFGANIDTDVILPARYLSISEPKELAKHLMEGIDPQFPKAIKPGDMIIATSNFGCGSSREHAPLAIKAAGISCIIAISFARIFFRNAINIGLPLLECDLAMGTESGDLVEVEFSTGRIINITNGKSYWAKPYPNFMLDIIKAGGLIEYTQRKLKGWN